MKLMRNPSTGNSILIASAILALAMLMHSAGDEVVDNFGIMPVGELDWRGW